MWLILWWLWNRQWDNHEFRERVGWKKMYLKLKEKLCDEMEEMIELFLNEIYILFRFKFLLTVGHSCTNDTISARTFFYEMCLGVCRTAYVFSISSRILQQATILKQNAIFCNPVLDISPEKLQWWVCIFIFSSPLNRVHLFLHTFSLLLAWFRSLSFSCHFNNFSPSRIFLRRVNRSTVTIAVYSYCF